ncbi:MAG: toll/interleukin-1 receptor domain-containing protein [Acidobacteria bacterium]|nr:toll/interleukin-1 receptor domain-containing protein [Acidobacteriota bacterium]
MKVRLYEILDSLCREPEIGRHYEDNDTWSYEDGVRPRIHITYGIDRTLRRVKVVAADYTIIPQAWQHVFLSYSHTDREWFKKLKRALWPLQGLNIHLWSDEDISPGQTWHDLILTKVSDASAALLLVSKAFLKSEFIREYELRRFLSRAEDPSGEPFLLLWIPLANRKTIEIDHLGSRVLEFQALLDPRKPLHKLKGKKVVATTLSKLGYKAFRAIYRQTRGYPK